MKWLALAVLAACTPAQNPQAFLDYQASFLRPGVDLATEEKEVRRVLEQRGMRVSSRLERPGFIALGASNRRVSALRVITGRGVVVAEDAELDDLFQPARVALIDGFGGEVGDYNVLAYTRTPARQDVGCVTLQNVTPEALVIPVALDVSDFGARACVSSLAQGGNGALRAKVAWPTLHTSTTPALDVELDFALQKEGQQPLVRLHPGPWIDQQTTRYNSMPLAKADFPTRHAAGVVRAALAKLAGKSGPEQLNLYRNAVGTILPASLESDVVAETLRHINSGWLESPQAPKRPDEEPAASPDEVVEPAADTR